MVQDENDSAVENHNEEQQKKEEPNVEERLLQVLESAMKPTEKLDKMSEEYLLEYKNRLSSFSSLTYFGKPSCLSPLVCARLGWRNAEPDLLVCSSCHVALAIVLPLGLSPDSKEKICNVYREKLANCHKPNCLFAVVAKEFADYDKSTKQDSIIPSYMTDVLPNDCVELVEHPSPSAFLQSRVTRLQECCPEGYKLPQELDIPQDLRQELDSFKMVDLLKTTDSSAGVLAILGWEPTSDTLETGVTPLSSTQMLGCRFCHSTMEVTMEQEEQEEEEERDAATTNSPPPAKKIKLSKACAPLDAHRHYCPYVCGFPSQLFSPKEPIWKTIVERLKKEAEEQAKSLQDDQEQPEQEQEIREMTEEEYDQTEKQYDETVYRINDILNAAIAPVDPRVSLLLNNDI